jgi:hypothetical protein
MEADMASRFGRGSIQGIVVALAVGALFALLASGCGSSSGSTPQSTSSASPAAGSAPSLAPIAKPYKPKFDQANMVRTIDNKYWPLKPGTTFHYKGVKGTQNQIDNETVTHQTKQILGVPATIVRDTVLAHGTPIERTFDWYAQDKYGNVWYMGENSLERVHGQLARASDSWEAGVNGGKPGIIMPGNPQPGDAYRQEYYPPGQALDEARVLSLDGQTTVPAGHFTGVLVTSERSPLEPQTEQKYYAPGTGDVKETVVKGHHEVFTLVSVTHR